jgi:2OG-Fe(II) oxygenase superfamily
LISGATCSSNIRSPRPELRALRADCGFVHVGPNIFALRLLSADVCRIISCKLRGWPEWAPSGIIRSDLDRCQIAAKDRCSLSLVGLEKDGDRSAVFAALQRTLVLASQQKWCFHGFGLSEAEIVKYTVGGFFRPHRDRVGPNDPRLLTAVVFLNDEHEGGRLRFYLRSKLDIAPEVGTVVVFPAEYVHESTPVSCGEKFVGVQCLFKRPTQLWLRRPT